MFHAMITILGSSSGKFIKPNHAPVLVRSKFTVRGIVEDNGRVFIPADFPTPSYYPNPENIIEVKLYD